LSVEYRFLFIEDVIFLLNFKRVKSDLKLIPVETGRDEKGNSFELQLFLLENRSGGAVCTEIKNARVCQI